MTDYYQVVDEIRSFTQSCDQVLNQRVRDLASMYTSLCQDANQRLRRCQEYLRQGMRSEAVQFSQEEPALLDVVAILDFPEREEWEQITATYDLEAAPRLLVETAEILNQAYAEVQPLEQLLREHRHAALSRAPVANRLAILHQIAAVDQANPVWNEDIRQLELLRFRQMESFAQEAGHQSNGQEILSVLNELQNGTWVQQPPVAVMMGIAKAFTQVAELELSTARRNHDYDRAKRIHDNLQQLSASRYIAPIDPLWNRIAPNLVWLEKHEQKAIMNQAHEQAAGELESALNRGLPVQELDVYYFELKKYRQGVPHLLQRRYDKQVRLLAIEGNRRENYFLIGATILAVIFFLGFVGCIVLIR